MKTEEDPSSAACSHNSATSTNRVPQIATTTSVANQFIFESVGFYVLHTYSGGNTGTKPSSKTSSTATATATKGVGVGATPSDPTDIHLTFSI